MVAFAFHNGFMHGEHRIVDGKGHPYEPSIHVPLLLHVPGVPQGVTRPSMAASIATDWTGRRRSCVRR